MATNERDFYTDRSVLADPYTWFEEMRAKGDNRICPMEHRKLLFVPSFQEAIAVLNEADDYSSATTVSGPLLPLPFETDGVEDITDLIAEHRSEIPMADLLVTKDGVHHANSRALISRLFTPSRLREMEEYMVTLADTMVGDVVAKGGCELINEIASPYVTYVISDLLGVPTEDRDKFREVIDAAPPPSSMEASPPPGKEREYAEQAKKAQAGDNGGPFAVMGGFFARYLSERRASPRDDLLSEFAQATYPDGTQPDIFELIRLSMFLFGAGQDTSAKLVGNCFKYLIDVPGMQEQLREDPKLIPAFIEEVLRLEGSTKTVKRLAKRATTISGQSVPPGQTVVVGIAAANRDPERWEDPQEFRLNRPRIREHLSFGRGAHTCAGAPLARVEVRILLEKFLAMTSRIDLDEQQHGTPGHRQFDYEASTNMRGMLHLHVKLTPA